MRQLATYLFSANGGDCAERIIIDAWHWHHTHLRTHQFSRDNSNSENTGVSYYESLGMEKWLDDFLTCVAEQSAC